MLFGVNLDGVCYISGLSVVEMWGVGGKKFITHCVMKNFVGPEGFSTGGMV